MTSNVPILLRRRGVRSLPSRKRYTPAEIEIAILPRIVDAIYPVLIPVEQQDCTIQARNHGRMVQLAKMLWREFIKEEAP